MNGDGFDDLLIGANQAEDETLGQSTNGLTFAIFGKAAGFGAVFDLSTLDASQGLRISGEDRGDNFGIDFSEAGDVNGDGFDDLLLLARFAKFGNLVDVGEAYVIYGTEHGLSRSFDLANLDASEGVNIRHAVAAYGFRIAVDSANGIDDVNGDEFDDIGLGVKLGNPPESGGKGSSFVVFSGDHAGLVTQQGTAAGEIGTGNGQANILVLGQGGGLDLVFGFINGTDFLDFTDFGFNDFTTDVQPLIRTIAGKAVIDFADGGRVVLAGIAEGDLDASEFIGIGPGG